MPSDFRTTNNPPAHKSRLTEKSRNTGDNVNPEAESLSACVGVACFIRLVDGFACGISGDGVTIGQRSQIGTVAGGFGWEFRKRGIFCRIADRAPGNGPKGGNTFSNCVVMLLYCFHETIEEEMKLVEARPTEIPMGLFGLGVEIATIGKGLVKQGGGFGTSVG